MRPLTLAVLSDLHIGAAVRAKDLCPKPDECKGVDDAYRQRFLDFLKRDAITADYLFLPGDVTDRAQTDEASLASDVVVEVARTLRVKKSNVVFVPGNHDVDWSVLKNKLDPVRWNQRYDTINYKDFAFRTIMGRGSGALLDVPYLNVWEFENLVVIGYNSSWHDNPTELIHHGRIDNKHLDQLHSILTNGRWSDEKLRVFLVHHHPIAYDVPAGSPDFSQMVNCERLFGLLRDAYVDLIIHGHTHQPRFQIDVRDASHPIGILAAGAFSLQLPLEWQGKVANQFHIIHIDGREAESNCIKGKVASWSYYLAHGWKPSVAARDGIAHVEPFGVYANPRQFRDLIRTALSDRFLKRDWIKWREISDSSPSFEYARPDAVFRALREVSEEFGIILHGDSLDSLVLLKQESLDA